MRKRKIDTSQFVATLQELITDSGMEFEEIEKEVEKLYAPDIRVTPEDLFGYLSGDRLPRIDKVCALCDACCATDRNFKRLMRCFPRNVVRGAE